MGNKFVIIANTKKEAEKFRDSKPDIFEGKQCLCASPRSCSIDGLSRGNIVFIDITTPICNKQYQEVIDMVKGSMCIGWE